MYRLLLLICLIPLLAPAQNVGVNTPTPDPSAVLDVTATDKGLLPPRLTTTQRDGIASPARGLMIYNTDTDCMEYWNGTEWISMCITTPPCSPPPTPVPNPASKTICDGSTLTLGCDDLGAGVSYLWNGPNGYTGSGRTPTVTTSAQTTHSGDYTVRSWAFGCYSDPATQTVTVLDDHWERLADFGGTTRTDPAGFLIGDTLYIAGGRLNGACGGNETNQFWAYSLLNNTWTQRTNIPSGTGHPKCGMSGFALGGLGYVGGGNYNCGYTYKSYYRYNPANGTWTASGTVANFPNDFSHTWSNGEFGGEGYVGFGHCGSPNGEGASNCSVSCQDREVYSYNPGTNTWTLRGSVPYTAPNGGIENPTILNINGRLYVGLGSTASYTCSGVTTKSQWFEYTGGTTWVARTSFPGTAGVSKAAFAVGSYGYVVDSNKSMYRYDPAADSWTALTCPWPGSGSSRYAYAVGYNGKGYLVDTNTRETWVFTP